MALTVGELQAYVRADDTGMRRGLRDAELRLRGFQVDAEGRLRTLNGRFATLGEQAAVGFRRADREGNRFSATLGRLAGMGRGLAGLAGAIGPVVAALGAAGPAAAGLAAAVGQIAPAAGLAVTGLISVVLASQALKLGMVGVGDAITAALDPEKAADFEKAISKLAPNAQAFARQVKELAPEFRSLQQAVQNQLFAGFDTMLKRMATTTLPVVRSGLTGAAQALNLMALGVGNTAIGLSKSGTLGKAIAGANAGLVNLSSIPGQLVQGLVQVGAAAAPAFARLTAGAGDAFDRFSARMSQAFESGAMQRAIEQAISLIGDLGTVLGNIGGILGSVFSAAQVSGGGFIGTLKEVTGAMRAAFASPEVQSGLRAIFQTMATLAQTAAPLLIQALKAVGPVFAALGPPVQTLIKALGSALQPVIKALGPVLQAAAAALGRLVEAASPLLAVAGQLIASILPAITPLFDALKVVINALAPVIAQLATTIGATLAPIITALTPIIATLAKTMGAQLAVVVGMVGQVVVALSPTLIQLGTIFGELLTALSPVITEITALGLQILTALMPFIQPLIQLVARLAGALAGQLGTMIRTIVVPALQAVAALLRGDFSGAFAAAKTMVKGVLDSIVRWFVDLPPRIVRALGNLGTLLYSKGVDIVRGLWRGIQSMGGWLSSQVSGWVKSVVPGPIASAMGIHSPSKVTAAQGRWIARGLIEGLTGTSKQVRSASQRLADIVEGALSGRRRRAALARIDTGTAGLSRLAARETALAARLKAANKSLQDQIKARDALSATVRKGVLDAADITKDADQRGVTATTIWANLSMRLEQARRFAAQLAQLRAKGLRADLIAQVAQAGVEQGAAAAAALAAASKGEIQQINSVQGQLVTAAGQAGNVAGQAMYGAGIQAAQGLVKGLQREQSAIERQMLIIAKAMQSAIKKALGIRSPSRVMAAVGQWIPAGLVQGIESGRSAVDASMAGLVTLPRPALAGVGAGMPAAGALGQPQGPIEIVLRSDGSRYSDFLVEELRKGIKARGGDADAVLSQKR
ncbi:hypothetical protein ACGF1Z_31110 [Streptomyces sp. NPDC048018]|uniref:phage tail protein n=1 Tax=Streptomyces sp. NPDC048018 TaxID=3365499 RepID=UPI00371D77BD